LLPLHASPYFFGSRFPENREVQSDKPSTPASPVTCAWCGAAGTGRFCGECGQPLLASHAAPALLLREDAKEALGLDARIGSTLRDLLIHPLRITRAWVAGDRSRYVQPIKVLLTLGAVYMLALSIVSPYSFDPRDLAAAGFDSGTADQLAKMIQESGVDPELVAERFQSRMNTTAPLIIALALFPMVGVLKLLRRHEPWYHHFLFMVGFSNVVWMVALLILPVSVLSPRLHGLVVLLATYAYLGVGYFAFYRERTRLKTASRFIAFALADFVVTSVVQLPLMWLIFLSAQRF
jgi:hypothetical protein